MVTLKNFKPWIKDRTFQALIFCDVLILILTLYFTFSNPITVLNTEIHISGWTSIGSLALGNYLGLYAIKTKMEVSGFLSDPQIKGAILHLDAALKAFDEFATTPEFLEFLQNLNKALKALVALEEMKK